MYAHCYRSGEIKLSRKSDLPGCICIGEGPKSELEAKLSARARHAYDGETFLVPGIPEAENDEAAAAALVRFHTRMKEPLATSH